MEEIQKFGHVMLDLETMGNKSNTAITAVGAIEFNIETGECGKEFYMPVDLQSALDIGLIVNASTIYWWLKQNEQARLKMCAGENGPHIREVLLQFATWYHSLEKYTKIWGNGARFDIGLMEDAYVKLGYLKMPWGFRDEMDLRTLVAFAPEIKNDVVKAPKEEGAEHDPIYDCKVQIEYASKIWNKLKIE